MRNSNNLFLSKFWFRCRCRVGSIAHADFAAGSQALLEALMPEDTEEEGSGEDAAEGEAAAETEAASDATSKRLVAMF